MKNGCSVLYVCIVSALMLQAPVVGEGAGRPAWVPMLGYEMLSLDSEDMYSISAGGVVAGETLSFVGLYTRSVFDANPAPAYSDAFHGIELLLDMDRNRHQAVGLFKSESDRPVSGGLDTFQAAAVYGYEIVSGSRVNLAVGGGLGVSDFGLDSPVIPVPFVRLKYRSPLLEAGFDFITGPSLAFTLFPQQRIRFNGDLRIDEFRDVRDLIFEASLGYRFFDSESPAGDFAGFDLGVKSDVLSFVSADHDQAYELHYYGAFARLDLTFMELTGGYAFEGRERWEDDSTADTGDGYFISLSGLWQF